MHAIRLAIFLNVLIYALPVYAFSAAWALVGENRWYIGMAVNFAPFFYLPAFAFFPLAFLVRAHRAALLTLPLVVGGAIAFGGHVIPQGAATRPPPAWTLNIITLNVSDSRQPMERIEAWLRAQDADVVVLQETPWHHPMLQAMTDLYPYTAEMEWGNSVWLLSRFPITSRQGFAYGDTGHRFAPRAVLQVTDAQQIVLYLANLPAPLRDIGRIPLPDANSAALNTLWDLVFGFDQSLRDPELTRLLQRADGETLPVILAGDFNLSEWSADYRHLAARYIDSYREQAPGFGFTFPAFEAFGLPRGLPALMRIDYIWHSPDLITLDARYGDYVGSDHLPVMATLGGY